MTDKLIIAAPSKGRLQENATAFFARAGLPLQQEGGARTYRGSVKGLPEAEVLFLSASDIVAKLASGEAHFGVTGEDLIRETIPDADSKVALLSPLGFGHADVVVAVPKGWIDARTMEDLEEIAADFHTRRGRRLRVATKYINLTRRFFARHGVADYRIVESLGATEGAPAAGTAELIVDITTTGATLEANALKILDDGVMLKSQANLVASLTAEWTDGALAAARTALGRIAAEQAARGSREIRATVDADGREAVAMAAQEAGATLASAPDTSPLVLTIDSRRAAEVSDMLVKAGARHVTVAQIDYAFDAASPLFEKLTARLGRRG
jgi:ATP phosphoribosyltransferase